jgi:ABC-2 type transport system ATP-binding protein
MIEVRNLTKWYGRTLALDRASFEVEEGQIVGFLGPNGAGKSTTLRILTGYLPATEGEARVAGHDVLLESLEVRRAIGYMPENVPLYPEMRVEEYLRFRAGLKDVPSRDRRKAVESALERCWLTERRRSLIGALSKGYRQRVGLADALVADPKVLILDEPTIGLDPTQIGEVRRLIRSLAERHTVLLSSHILPEVERTCSHLVIIANGRIAASGTVEDLREGFSGRSHIVLEVRPKTEGPAEVGRALGQAAGVSSAKAEATDGGWMNVDVTPAGDADPREALHAVVAQRGWALREMHRRAPSIEELYVRITAGEAAARAETDAA